VIASAEAAADVRELRVDARGLERCARIAEEECNGFGSLVWRLHAEHELETFAPAVIPGESTLRLEEHGIDGLRLELTVQH
jgi:hypothetical protein